ncbi:MAG: PEP-CTERM sorting domain-containing protein [Phycisphaeraceae bacterium]|nr:MAG: PEP-CTERM sorting domain-containing protein [Phycisphaeraceae bacterium]
MKTILAVATLALTAGAAAGDIITQWDFNGPRAGKNLTAPATSIGLGSASLVGGTTAAWAAGSPNDPAVTDDDRWNTTTYAAQGTGSGTRGVEYAVSTVGYTNISFTADIRNSNTSSRWIEILAAYDGVNFVSVGTFNATAGDQWNTRSVILGAAADNNASLRIQVVAIFDPAAGAYTAANPTGTYATSGTIGYDLVTFEGTLIPTPGAAALMALGGLVAARRRR